MYHYGKNYYIILYKTWNLGNCQNLYALTIDCTHNSSGIFPYKDCLYPTRLFNSGLYSSLQIFSDISALFTFRA
jgi:hypothetical protein